MTSHDRLVRLLNSLVINSCGGYVKAKVFKSWIETTNILFVTAISEVMMRLKLEECTDWQGK